MLNLIYTLVMLFGLWGIAYLVFEFKKTKDCFYLFLLPINISFWFVYTIPTLIWASLPDLPVFVGSDILKILSCLFIFCFPFSLQYLLNQKNKKILYGFAFIAVINILVSFSFFGKQPSDFAGLFYFVSMLGPIFYGLYLFFVLRLNKETQGYTFCVRWLVLTFVFLPGIILDIFHIPVIKFDEYHLGLSSIYYVFVIIIQLTLPKKRSFDQPVNCFSDFLNRYGLTKREAQILKEILKGQSNQEIADQLFISLHTVKRHVKHIFEKANVKSRFELMQMVQKAPKTE